MLIDPAIWGPVFWDMLFDAAHLAMDPTVREKHMDDFVAFFTKAQLFFPCIGCRKHYEAYLDQCCEPLSCADLGQEFLFPLKNSVNRKLGRPELSRETYITRRQEYPFRGNQDAVRRLLAGISEKFNEVPEVAAWVSTCEKLNGLFAGCVPPSEPAFLLENE